MKFGVGICSKYFIGILLTLFLGIVLYTSTGLQMPEVKVFEYIGAK